MIIDLWHAVLDLPDVYLDPLVAMLSPEEKNRADRRREAGCRRFMAARGILRMILGRYLGIAPDAVPVTHDASGKPCLIRAGSWPKLHFSISHSGRMGLFGFCIGRAIGVDIEYIRPVDKMDAIARRFFTDAEINALRRAEASQKAALFFRIWTMKEAWVKATGEGIGGLKRIKQIKKIPGDCSAGDHDDQLYLMDQSGQHWQIRPVAAAAGYAAAIAVSSGLPDRL